MRRLLAGAVAVLAFAAPASASELVTWTTSSRFVDPAKEPFNGPPPGAPERPNALRVNVLLPDGYDGKRRFPVLWLLHGHGDGYDYWANKERGDVAEIAKGLGAIVVMPEGARGWYANWWKGGTRRPGWEGYHLDELLPLTERRLKIRRGRRWHAIAGLSMGGGGSLLYAELRPGYFGSAASFSGAISIQRPEWPVGFDTQGEKHDDVYGDPESNAFYWTAHNPTALVDNLTHTRVYVTVGDGTPTMPEDFTNYFGQVAERDLKMHAEDFTAAAKKAGVDVTYEPRAGVHDWPYWREHLKAAIRWGFFKRVDARPERWTYTTAARRSEAWGFRFFFPIAPGDVVTFSRNGKRLRGEGSGSVRIRTPAGKRLRKRLPFEVKLP